MELQEILKEYLDELEIKYFTADYFEGSDYEGYACIYVDNDNFSINILEELGFEKVKSDFFIVTIDKLKKIKQEEIEDIKLSHSERYSIKNKDSEFRRRILQLQSLWEQIVKIYFEINTYFYREHSRYFFSPYLETIDRALRLPLLIVIDEKSLEEFCYCLYQVFYECVSLDTKEYIGNILKKKIPFLEEKGSEEIAHYWKEDILENDEFYCDINFLRHYYIHLKGANKETKDYWEKKFKECLSKRKLMKLSNDYQYSTFQKKVLKELLEYLNKLHDIFRTHDCFQV